MNISKIRNLCEQRQGGIKQLAKEIGMTPANLHRRLNANDIMSSDLEKISHVLGVSITEFFDEEVVVAPVKKYENNGHHNPFAPEGEAKNIEGVDIELYKDLIKAKDDLIAELRLRIKELEGRV